MIRQRLKDLGLEQKGLAIAAGVTESYVSQLLARKKAPPAPRRTDIYDRMELFLELPRGELARLAEMQRKEEKRAGEPAQPMFPELRELIFKKCLLDARAQIRTILEREPFGELERLVGQKFLDIARSVAAEEAPRGQWLRRVTRLSGKSPRQALAAIQKALAAKPYSVPVETFVPFLEPLIESWTMDLETFTLEIVLNRTMATHEKKRYEFVEVGLPRLSSFEAGLEEFLRDKTLSADLTLEERQFLKTLQPGRKKPTALYYYRELQNLRDPLHFRDTGDTPKSTARISR